MVGVALGTAVVGAMVGSPGLGDGRYVGNTVGFADGLTVGDTLGLAEGLKVGLPVGDKVGK